MIKVEVTDTFAGEANYSWVHRFEMDAVMRTDRQVIREAKRLAGWTGLACAKACHGDMIELRRRDAHQILFITWE